MIANKAVYCKNGNVTLPMTACSAQSLTAEFGGVTESGSVVWKVKSETWSSYNAESSCDDCVKTVNGIAPDENGNVVVSGGSGGNVAYDEAQELTEEQKAQARQNIGAQPAGNYLTQVPEGYAKTEDVPTDEEIIQLIEEHATESSGSSGFVFTNLLFDEDVGQFKVDKTHQELCTARENRKPVFLMNEGFVYECTGFDANMVTFQRNEIAVTPEGTVYFSVITLNILSDDTVTEGYTEVLVSGELLE